MRIEEVSRGLAERLRERRGEIEQATMTRIRSVSDSPDSSDPEYTDGLRAAVSVALEFGIESVERSEDRPAPIPTTLLSQARLAARHGVKLETVLRRYLAGYTLLGDFMIEESARGGPLDGSSLKRLLRVQAALLDRLIAAVSGEYAREAAGGQATSEQRRAEHVRRLLAGELLDATELEYNLNVHHLGAIAAGSGAAAALRDLSAVLDARLLLVPQDVTAWAWFGTRGPLDPDEIVVHLSKSWPTHLSLAIGEPARCLAGWRLTHHQARAALPIALRRAEPFVRYADVALLASILQDDLLATSLHQIYLAPLGAERDGGKALRETLRAYFAAERNVSSTAAALGVSRQTVVNRLRVIEERFDRSLNSCAAEIQAGLSLEDMGHPFSLQVALPRA